MKFQLKNYRCLLFAILMYGFFVSTHTTAQEQIEDALPGMEIDLNRGKLIYRKFCALCHGVNLEGQKNWRIRNSNGKLPAPPHDESGHTWHHDDELLFGIIKNGLVPPYAPENYASDMPAWKDTLNDADIWAVLGYIKSQWPTEIQKNQNEITRKAQQP